MISSPSRLLRLFGSLALICAACAGCSTSNAQASAQSTATPQANAADSSSASTLPANTVSYTPEKTETVNAIAHRFLSQSSIMLASELEGQIRETNHLAAKQLYVKKGQTLLIP